MFEKIRRPGRSLKEGSFKKIFYFLVFGTICLVFVFLAPMGIQLMGEGYVAYVGNEPISGRELRFTQQSISEQYKSRLEQAGEGEYQKIQDEIKQKALAYLIEMNLMVQGSQKAGFELNDGELRSEIQAFPVFRQNDRFSYSQYMQFLKLNNLKAEQFENRVRKLKWSQNWQAFFKKTIPNNRLETAKSAEKYLYKANFRYITLKAGDVKEAELEAWTKAKNTKQINRFVKKNSLKWETTGLFNLFSAFGIAIASNQDVMEAVIHQLPATGLLPRLIRQKDKIYVVDILFFQQKGSISPEEQRMESFFSRSFDKSGSVFSDWLDLQRKKIKVRLSDKKI